MKPLNLAAVLGLPELPAHLQKVEEKMLLAVAPAEPFLSRPIAGLIRNNGKRLRPALVIAAAVSRGDPVSDDVITAAAAIELAHLASLVHDDLLDNAPKRWNQPTISAKDGPELALLVGDYLLVLACRQAAAVSAEVGVVVAAAIAKMVNGQSLETANQFNAKRSLTNYHETIRLKTGALMAAACQCGGLSNGLSTKSIMALRQYGEAFGAGFQLLDDLLDIVATEKKLGKPVGHDIQQGVYTLPILLARDGPVGATVQKWLGRRGHRPAQAEIINTLQSSGAIEATIAEIQKYNTIATTALKSIPVVNNLATLPDQYFTWAIQTADPV